MRVLVTGGAGYIGSVVVEELVGRGHRVVVYDDLRTGHRDAAVPEATFVEGDVLDRERLAATLRGHAVEAVVHMAASSLVGESVAHPSAYYRNNLEASLALVDAMRAAGVGALVFSSTAAVYGDSRRLPLEETHPTEPTNPYGHSKLAFEQTLPWFERAHGLRWISLRYFNAAGATERNGERHHPETHLIPLVLKAALGQGPAVPIFGDDYPTRDGTCVRDYVHVADLARAHVLAMDALASGKPSGVYNLGCGGKGYTVREVIDVARAVTGREIPVQAAPRRPGDPAVLVASSERIRRELGWVPEQPGLDAIIASAWRWLTKRQR